MHYIYYGISQQLENPEKEKFFKKYFHFNFIFNLASPADESEIIKINLSWARLKIIFVAAIKQRL